MTFLLYKNKKYFSTSYFFLLSLINNAAAIPTKATPKSLDVIPALSIKSLDVLSGNKNDRHNTNKINPFFIISPYKFFLI